ncbi:Bug family tripartite tricarboxylate transporter substrate binding protein [Parapusillimonas granuli]|uniref:Tripartite tricarboxylate transporter substrate binding protein n=1 Tax=Parapusillimonas granuli TaxID=380911 RepID=A0A853FVN2_9BURK|nr:tripartite tricarboxylate transporter substrate binding protein [Parapusillimonas granuli]MBB5214734.1 tripartite-type tricarboxylate transporter receptor subunit TctC [Parapusillimonas granuli]MEB2398018.1 tripartite tricarboxylate transporter substrate binding protein [Alcaligenaceae bacterium]NYT48858.1 tripartite tricarboxylate transporter substrate binding protein [Parapusillimonas granuli]
MKFNPLARLGRLIVALPLAIGALTAAAAPYPAKPVRIVVPAGAGSNPDLIARIYAQKLSELYGQSFYVENKPGAGGSIGLAYASKLAPDGYSLVIGALGNLAINPSVYTRLPYDAQRDFAPVAQLVKSPLVLAAAKTSSIHTLADLIEQAKAKPTKLTFSSGGNGTGQHLSGEYLNTSAGITLTHIPFSSTPASIVGVAGGEIDIVFGNQAGVWPLVQSGKLTALAVTSDTRLSRYPDTPTMDETLKGFEIYDWSGFLVPAGTPLEIVQDLHAKLMKIQEMPDVRNQLEASGFIIVESTRDEFRDFIANERRKWGGIAKQVGIKLD